MVALLYGGVGESDNAESESLFHRHFYLYHQGVDALHGGSVGLGKHLCYLIFFLVQDVAQFIKLCAAVDLCAGRVGDDEVWRTLDV